ncbi:MAG: LamG-like jellyroll fold domain-containing protein, partial [Acidobacteriota bacterium]
VGTGRDDGTIPPNPYGWIDTTVQFGSTEHRLNVSPQMVPRTPRDVVWQISAGSRTAEIAFDDLISQRTLIYSPMNAVKAMNGTTAPYYDGVSHPEMRLQNAATSLVWQTPSHGQVTPEAGSTDQARIEHVALGGIEGRGFYLFPKTRVDYAIAGQPDLGDTDWLLSIFVDPRNVPQHVRRLVTLPSQAYIDLHGIWWTRLCTANDVCTSLRLLKPALAGQWSHLAYRLQPVDATTGAPARVDLYQDGFLVDSVTAPDGFAIGGGTLSVGAPPPGPTVTTQGVEGWIDDFKLISGPFSPEEVCNHARGSLVAVPHDYLSTAPPCDGSGPCARDLLQPFALETLGREAVHRALHGDAASIGDPLTTTADHTLCLVDYRSPHGISLADLDDGLRSVRRRLLFPEGPLVWNQPRPESRTNAFCLACHHPGAPKPSLLPAALALDPSLEAHEDPRRQPNQPEAAMHGWMPAEYFGELQPITSFAHDPQLPQAILDRYLDDGPLFRWTFDEAAGDVARNWVLGRPGESTGDGTIHGATFADGSEIAGTVRGHALDFDGSAHVRIDQPFDITGGEVSLAGWFRLAAGAENACRPYVGGTFPCTLMAKSGSGTHALWSLRVFHDSGLDAWKVQFKVSPDAVSFESLSDVLDTTPSTSTVDFDPVGWHHLAAVYSAEAEVMELYLDGVLLTARPATGTGPGSSVSHGVTLGARLDGAGHAIHPFAGRLDELHVFDRRLLATEVDALVASTP